MGERASERAQAQFHAAARGGEEGLRSALGGRSRLRGCGQPVE